LLLKSGNGAVQPLFQRVYRARRLVVDPVRHLAPDPVPVSAVARVHLLVSAVARVHLPVLYPSLSPREGPIESPSAAPSASPSDATRASPSAGPSLSPSEAPSSTQSASSTVIRSSLPTGEPSSLPSTGPRASQRRAQCQFQRCLECKAILPLKTRSPLTARLLFLPSATIGRTVCAEVGAGREDVVAGPWSFCWRVYNKETPMDV
jgi:hypothetical protein